MTFSDCLYECAANREFISNFDRLYGSNLSRSGSPIELMVDDSSGRTDADAKAFINFVWQYVWCPLLAQVGAQQ